MSYASEDRQRVLPYYDLLESHGFDPWMDCKKVLGGQNWDYEIKTALERSDVVVVFVTSNSVDKRGYAQREIKAAIDKYEEKILGDIYIVPIQLDPGDFPYILKGIQFIRAYEQDAEKEILKSIEAASRLVKENTESEQIEAEVRWSTTEIKSSYNGIPGYSITRHKLSISSAKYSNVREIADHVNGILSEYSMNSRGQTLEPDPSRYNLMQDEWSRTNTFDAVFTSAHVIGRTISIKFSMNWYSAGAAHPVHAPKFFNYLLDPVYYLSFRKLFKSEESFSEIQRAARASLKKDLLKVDVLSVGEDHIFSGSKDWSDFSNFSFEEKGISLQFPSYHVAPYVAGMPIAEIPYEVLKPFLKDSIVHALNLTNS